MRIRITSATSVSDGAGHRYRGGQVVDVDDDLAAAWVAAGHAAREREPRTAPKNSGRAQGRKPTAAKGARTAPPAEPLPSAEDEQTPDTGTASPGTEQDGAEQDGDGGADQSDTDTPPAGD